MRTSGEVDFSRDGVIWRLHTWNAQQELYDEKEAAAGKGAEVNRQHHQRRRRITNVPKIKDNNIPSNNRPIFCILLSI
jgi:hypothetical protein